jgi:long-chain acyl-CoA synthetase
VTSTILREREAMERAIASRTLCEHLAATAARWGGLPAFSDRNDPAEPWQTITWASARQRAAELAAGFIELGLRPGERVALTLPNRVEHVLADLGVVHAGGVPVTVYSTFAPGQVRYVARDCDARIAVLDGETELRRWQPVLGELSGLRRIIVRDAAACPAHPPRSAGLPGTGDSAGLGFLTWEELLAAGRRALARQQAEIARRTAALGPDDVVTVLYTSGTTGNPKGVRITHRSVLYECATATASGTVTPHIRWVSYLPLAHIAERMFSIYLAIHSAAHVHFCHEATTGLVQTVGAVRPTGFFGVPRVWEKIQAGIQAVLAAEPDPARRAAVAKAMRLGRRYVESCQFGRSPGRELTAEFRSAEETMLRPIRALLGLGDAEVVSSAAAPLPRETSEFFAGLGLKILDVYGMTETTGAFTANTPAAFRLGTVGRAVPGTEIRIADDGEILTRGPLNTPGYLNQPDLTAELIDADGWLHTGDIGALDQDGFLSVVDRKKELIITAGGENISPAAVENLLVAHPLIGQALAYGDRRPYLVALLTLDGAVAPAWAAARGIEASSLAELAEDPVVTEEVARAVARANAELARIQQVKRWHLLPAEWTAESEELTPTLKLRRRVVHAKYADVIGALYD